MFNLRVPLRACDDVFLMNTITDAQLIVSSDCGFGRQGGNRDIAFFKSSSIAQGANIVRRELGLPTTRIPAADLMLQTDIVPKTNLA
jgi:5-methyltetrahydropteroyltriglutamate--homocysteine methyltransferase